MEEKNAELLQYISEMVLIISTGDEEADQASIELVAESIHSRAV